MKDEIRIRLSVGLIVVAVLHAVMLGAVFTALHRTPEPEQDTSWQVPPATPVPQVSRSIEKLPEPAQVNLEAQGELKQQYGNCPPLSPRRGRRFDRIALSPPIRSFSRPRHRAPSTVPTPPRVSSAPIIIKPTFHGKDEVAPDPVQAIPDRLVRRQRCQERATHRVVQQRPVAFKAQGRMRVPGLHRRQQALSDSL